jgi:hypothetical protein
MEMVKVLIKMEIFNKVYGRMEYLLIDNILLILLFKEKLIQIYLRNYIIYIHFFFSIQKFILN